jgi:hypothetical protein
MKTSICQFATRLPVIAALGAALFMGPTLQAALLAEDGFKIGTNKAEGEWTAGGVHDGGNGSIVIPGWTRVLGPAKTIHATGLEYLNLVSAGAGSVNAHDWWSYRDTLAPNGSAITYNAAAGHDAVYMSFLTQHSGSQAVQLGWGVGGDNGAGSPFGIRASGSNHAFHVGGFGGTTHDLGVALSADVNLWVIRHDYVGNTVSVWLNPTALGGAAPAATLTVNYSSPNFNRVLFGQSGTDSRVDEMRIGTSYASVTPIPEPGTYALLAGFGVLAFVVIRRRFRK